jgi:hypothetical protein
VRDICSRLRRIENGHLVRRFRRVAAAFRRIERNSA